MQRNKGRAGEQEVARILRDQLGVDITRAWQRQAARTRNSDLDGLPGWAVEVKRAKVWRNDWWVQTLAQADQEGSTPVLLYRLDGAHPGQPDGIKWRAVLPLVVICTEDVDPDLTAEIPLAAWIQIVRERLVSLDAEIEQCERSPAPPVPINGRSLRHVPRTTLNTPPTPHRNRRSAP
jgi:hypothetical protein